MLCCCCEPVKLRRSVQGPTVQRQQEALQSTDLMLGRQSVHLPLIMELMLWLMMRSAVFRCSSDDFELLSGDEGCVVSVIFGCFGLPHFAASQG